MAARIEPPAGVAVDAPGSRGDHPAKVHLRPLAAEYVQEHHLRYVEHLDRAVKDPRIKNIALTGRYGSGKSSVLDEFETRHARDTLRISINTLGPDDGEDLTNRIQKELVKQLVYRAKPGQVRRSRFVRSRPLTVLRAFTQSVAIAGVGLILLWLLGWWPQLSELPGLPATAAESASALFISLIVTVVWAGRWLIGNRIVSQVSTAGTAFTLDDRPDTYFDKFLDEIMMFFDGVRPKFVVFEDLDRFDDPQIFDSLRELNTLVNSSAHRTRLGPQPREPVRFIFAIKDSLFEQLGVDSNQPPQEATGDGSDPAAISPATKPDVALAAVERANRTKFFELVIPVVPFLSHRNARDLLVEAFTALGFPTDLVSRSLLDLVARHTTDMRLMINICNEYAVFAEHLLQAESSAPGMRPDNLFALVSYKNFHLADFEMVAQRASSLDTLEKQHRTLVRTSIDKLQAKKRGLRTANELQGRQDETAKLLGTRLMAYKNSLPNASGYAYRNFAVAGRPHPFEAATDTTFWREVAAAGAITITHNHYPVELDVSTLAALFPEGVDEGQWRAPGSSDWELERVRIDTDITFLRGADFSDLARRKEFMENGCTFDQLITSTLLSELARDLVRKGFIGRNFAEYSAKFYGSFVGVDVAFFYNHSVQPNVMYVDHQFKTPGSVKNLLEQVPDDFTSTVSALNIQVVDYLLTNDPSAAKRVAAFIASDFTGDAVTFLNAFLNETAAQRAGLVGLLAAQPWRDVFDHLATSTQLPDEETRIQLLDAALLGARTTSDYTLNRATRELLVRAHAQLSAFTQDQSNEQTKTIFSFAQDAELIITELDKLGGTLRGLVVSNARYALTSRNLRVALGSEDSPTLERVRSHELVWRYCRENIDQYVNAIQEDAGSEFGVTTHGALSEVITEQHGVWTDDQLRMVVRLSSPAATLPDITTVPARSWPVLLDLHRVVPTVANVRAYALANNVDATLGDFLAPQGQALTELCDVDSVGAAERERLAVLILNASTLPTATRVQLATQLRLSDGVKPVLLVPADNDLLALLLEAQLVPDDAATFTHFAQAGWDSVSAAFAASTNMSEILSPALVSGFVAELLNSAATPDAVRTAVVGDLASYLPSDDVEALRAAGKYAADKWIKLPLDQIRRIARVTQSPEVVLPHLVRTQDLSTPNELVSILVLLGSPYDELTKGSGREFGLPPGSSSQTLFLRLAEHRWIEITKKGRTKVVRTLM